MYAFCLIFFKLFINTCTLKVFFFFTSFIYIFIIIYLVYVLCLLVFTIFFKYIFVYEIDEESIAGTIFERVFWEMCGGCSLQEYN